MMGFEPKEAQQVMAWYLHALMWSIPFALVLDTTKYFFPGFPSKWDGVMFVPVMVSVGVLALYTSTRPRKAQTPEPTPPEEEIPEWVIQGDAMTCISKAASAFDNRLTDLSCKKAKARGSLHIKRNGEVMEGCTRIELEDAQAAVAELWSYLPGGGDVQRWKTEVDSP